MEVRLLGEAYCAVVGLARETQTAIIAKVWDQTSNIAIKIC